MLGVDSKTVGTERKRLIGTAEIPQLEVTEGFDGKKHKKPIRTAFIDDTPEGEELFWLAVPAIGLIGFFAKVMGWMA